MGRKLTKQEREERKELKNLIRKIRKTKKYRKWKRKILMRDVRSYPDIPKGVQVHHKTEISKLILKYKITTVREAIECDELWYLDLGITLKRGEHFIFTKLGRYKYITRGFLELLNHWVARTEEDHLDVNEMKKRRRKTR